MALTSPPKRCGYSKAQVPRPGFDLCSTEPAAPQFFEPELRPQRGVLSSDFWRFRPHYCRHLWPAGDRTRREPWAVHIRTLWSCLVRSAGRGGSGSSSDYPRLLRSLGASSRWCSDCDSWCVRSAWRRFRVLWCLGYTRRPVRPSDFEPGAQGCSAFLAFDSA